MSALAVLIGVVSILALIILVAVVWFIIPVDLDATITSDILAIQVVPDPLQSSHLPF